MARQTRVKSPPLKPGEIEHVMAHCLSRKQIGEALLRVCEREHAEWAHILILCVSASLYQIPFYRGAFLGWLLHFRCTILLLSWNVCLLCRQLLVSQTIFYIEMLWRLSFAVNTQRKWPCDQQFEILHNLPPRNYISAGLGCEYYREL